MACGLFANASSNTIVRSADFTALADAFAALSFGAEVRTGVLGLFFMRGPFFDSDSLAD